MSNPELVGLLNRRVQAVSVGDWDVVLNCDIDLSRKFGIVIRDDEEIEVPNPPVVQEKRGPGRPRKNPLPQETQ